MFRMVFIPCVIDRSMSCTLDGSVLLRRLNHILGRKKLLRLKQQKQEFVLIRKTL